MPASRSERAMTFAPRSWPSRPALAITTRMGRSMGWSVSTRTARESPGVGLRVQYARPDGATADALPPAHLGFAVAAARVRAAMAERDANDDPDPRRDPAAHAAAARVLRRRARPAAARAASLLGADRHLRTRLRAWLRGDRGASVARARPAGDGGERRRRARGAHHDRSRGRGRRGRTCLVGRA